MKSTFFALAAMGAAGSASAAVSAYGQCGGQNFSGETECVSGYSCQKQNDWYSQCVAGGAAAATTLSKAASVKPAAASSSSSCSVKYVTKPLSEKPAATQAASKPASTQAASKPAATQAAPSSTQAASSKPASSQAASSTKATAPASSSSAAAVKPAAAVTTSSKASGSGVQYAGVNIAGLDFGCGTDGTCNSGSRLPPGQDGLDQMNHFVKDDGLNTFRIPVGWQFLVDDKVGGTLSSANWAVYDEQIQNCLTAGAALCIIDIHNYARWNGQIVGQGGPTDADFASLWSQIATKYKSNDKIAFGIMNEPHDVTIDTWATTVQAAVTAIRKAGATKNKLLLPGNEWTHASALIDNGSAAALNKITNLDGTTDNLIFDVHQYLDSDGSGTHTTCTTNNVAAFTTLGDWLRTNKRQAILTETGGSDDASCLTMLCEQFDALNKYSDVYLGWTGWSAGKFDASYELTETPSKSGSSWTDRKIVTQCVAGKFNKA